MNDYFSFPSLKNDDVAGVAGALLTPAEMEGYLSPLDSPIASTLSSQLEEAVTLPLPGQDDVELPGDEPARVEDAKAKVRSPSAFATVLNQDPAAPPPAQSRFLHGGPPLSELEAPSVNISSNERKNRPIANAEWRAFTDEEQGRLEAAWKKVQDKHIADKNWPALGSPVKEKLTVKCKDGTRRVAEDGEEEEDHLVPVGLDNLFTVDLIHKVLAPAFWTGTPVRIILAHWFYAPPSIADKDAYLPSHHLKPYPVDPSLSSSLDRAYSRIRPWEAAYGDELAAALKGGPEAQLKLAVPLAVENEAETAEKRDLGIEVIFEGKDRGRVYSRGMVGSMSKSFFSSGKSLGGGQVIVRGWDALKAYLQEKAPKKSDSSTPARSRTPNRARNASPSPASSTVRGRATSTASTSGENTKRSESPGLFASLRNRIVGAPAPPEGGAGEASEGLSARASLDGIGNLPNETQAALEREPRDEDGSKIGAVSELVLIVHGIGQGLATTYDSFAFQYAANDFRSACTTLSTSETLSPLLKGKRMQTIPVLWRTDLDFDEIDDAEETADERLENRFSLKDIEVTNSVPFLRQVVSGLVLDVPFYLTPVHKAKMLRSVVKEANRIYRLFCKRNPTFSGKVSIIAHSLGSCLITDILSAQPTLVKDLDKPGIRAKHDPTLTFCFDTRAVFLVGSPLAFFLHLGKGQLIARAGRKRTKGVAKDVALDRAGRLGCLACDTVYNVYHETDPVVFALNPTVDARYAKLIRPVPIPSSNQTLLQNLSDAYHRVSRIFDFSYLWSSGEAKQTPEQVKEQAEKQAEETKDKVDDKVAAAKARRPGAMKRMPSERPEYGMGKDEFEWVSRAEKRFKALNPSGTIDWVLPAEGVSQYIDALYAHQGYWTDRRFCAFILTQLFADEELLAKAGVEELGIAEEEIAEEDESGE
ncbi:hypothetical protein JCM11251_003790 [Rhodosporidiobolus azoricus]